MAPPVDEKGDKGNKFDGAAKEGHENIWENILKEVQTSSSNKLPSNKLVLVLGDNESGKTTLIARIQGNEDPKKGSGLEYTYINVKDEYREDQTRLGVWILDGELCHRGLLRYALPNPDSLPNSMALLVVSMAQPWAVMETLERWAQVLTHHIERLKVPVATMDELKAARVLDFQEYTEPETVSSAPRRTGTKEEEKVLLPLEEETLTSNLGIPLVVVVTKSDAIGALEKEFDFKEEHFDFIQQYIRKFCLQYGAALFYTSVKEDKNCELLYRYVVHKMYGFPFNTPAFVVERDSVFVPLGWDNERKISILYDSITNVRPEDPFEDVITKPGHIRKPIQRDADATLEEEQVFLMKQQSNLKRQPSQSGESPSRPTPPRSNVTVATPPANPSPATPGTGRKDAPTPGSASSQEGVLANFFNSLLNKKPGVNNPNSPHKSSVSREAQAELDRMNRKKPPVTHNSHTTNSSNS